uniref:Nuclease associated modular domain-containing protein n=1 Tax=Davidia involucrata TaxID=16924 RepID=A0A5B7ADN6_DAVIN
MPLLDIAFAQPSFQNHAYKFRARTLIHCKFIFGNEKRLASPCKSFRIPNKEKNFNFNLGRIEMQRSELVTRAVATLEPKCSVQSHHHHNLELDIDSRSPVIQPQYSSEDSEELDEKEKLRRMRISKANKGNTPWNKGRKHSPEIIQRIRERTWLAMQDPKVKMKLVNLGHAQSKETRIKIGVGVRMGWERRREKLMLQEGCYFEWQNLIAEATRRGFVGEEELQWDSYKILDEHLEQEWLESIEQRKKWPTRLKGNRRAPKSLEQRRKISEAISAKWAEPGYRDRVYSALSKYHGTLVGAERKPRRKPSGERQPLKRIPAKKKPIDADSSAGNETKSQSQRSRLRRSNMALYKDPLASSKLEMIKNIKAQRVAAETKKTEAVERAKLLIAEAEKAAKALEVAAMSSPLAQASLIETRKLIAEAIQSIESIGTGQAGSYQNGRHPSFASNGLVNHVEKEKDAGIEGLSQTHQREINSIQALESSDGIKDSNFGKFNFQDLLNGKDEQLLTRSSDHGLLNGKERVYQIGVSDYGSTPSGLDRMIKQPSFTKQLGQLELNGNSRHEKKPLPNGAKFQSGKEETPPNSITITKKWVRGKLVEVAEGD